MVEPEPEPHFHVRDRRRWVEQPGSEAQAPAAERPEAPREPTRGAPPRREPAREPRPPATGAGTAAPERSLVGLFMMLASLAAAAIDGMPDPATGRVHRDLQQAAEMVDVLMLLRERTEGRLTSEESQVLGDLIYDIQMRYMGATKRPG